MVKYNVGMRIAKQAISKSWGAVSLLAVVMIIVALIASSLMFWAERGVWDEKRELFVRIDGNRSPYSSIPEGFYWAITTLATVGYGDVTPITRKSCLKDHES